MLNQMLHTADPLFNSKISFNVMYVHSDLVALCTVPGLTVSLKEQTHAVEFKMCNS